MAGPDPAVPVPASGAKSGGTDDVQLSVNLKFDEGCRRKGSPPSARRHGNRGRDGGIGGSKKGAQPVRVAPGNWTNQGHRFQPWHTINPGGFAMGVFAFVIRARGGVAVGAAV